MYVGDSYVRKKLVSYGNDIGAHKTMHYQKRDQQQLPVSASSNLLKDRCKQMMISEPKWCIFFWAGAL